MQENNQRIALRVSFGSIVVNLLLAAFKLAAGIVAQSGAMVSDAVHSASDVFSTFIVIIGVRMAGKPEDVDHPYGHERLESVAAMILAFVLVGTALGIGWTGVQKITSGDAATLSVPGMLALVAALASIAIKEIMYRVTHSAAKKIASDALMADAWHHRSDALSSIGSFVGILGARLGFPILDPIASVVICLFIVKAALDIFRHAVAKITDRACDAATEAAMLSAIAGVEGVESVDRLDTRVFGNRVFVDVEVTCDRELPLKTAHAIAARVHDRIETDFEGVKHCMVHVNPSDALRDETPPTD